MREESNMSCSSRVVEMEWTREVAMVADVLWSSDLRIRRRSRMWQ